MQPDKKCKLEIWRSVILVFYKLLSRGMSTRWTLHQDNTRLRELEK